MALPKEPRQKMINIMYLVLTALLALNVSAEILNAFKTVDNSLIATNKTITLSTDQVMKSLEDKKSDPQSAAKAAIWYPKAEQARIASKEVFDYVQSLRERILKDANFNPKDSSFKMDNLDIATRVMITEGEGKKLQQKLNEYRQKLFSIDPEIASTFKNSLQVNTDMPIVQNKSNKTWEAAYFHMVPVVASMTILSKFQNDIKTSENKVVTFCHEKVGQVVVRFDQFATILGQSSNYLMPGQEIEIMAGVGAFSKAAAPKITINGQGAALGEDGAAKVKFPAGGVGTHTIPVHFVYTDQEGNEKVVDKTIQYTVGSANASIALDDMNVLYIGIDNKLTIAASGGGDDKVQASISGGGGSLRRVGGGKWVANVSSITDDATITVVVDGKTVGASQFRVRTIPPASAFVGSWESGYSPSAQAFLAQAGVGAGIKNFPLNLSYKVESFTVTCDNDEGDIDPVDVQGNVWSQRAIQMLRKNVKQNRLVTIDNIRVRGPDGKVTPAPSLVYYIK